MKARCKKKCERKGEVESILVRFTSFVRHLSLRIFQASPVPRIKIGFERERGANGLMYQVSLIYSAESPIGCFARKLNIWKCLPRIATFTLS